MIRLLKTWPTRFIILLLALGLQQAAAQDHARSTKQCYDDWVQATQIVEKQSLVTVELLNAQFRRQKVGVIVKTQLCRNSGKYEYRLVIRSPKGRFQAKTYDAHLGIEIGVAGAR
ncbi:MAG: hypothetical protein K0U74_03500 [Alphaproteobacteria bacterium]|nr:hypothetical protein [Alphaproteobacteria bacterium]